MPLRPKLLQLRMLVRSKPSMMRSPLLYWISKHKKRHVLPLGWLRKMRRQRLVRLKKKDSSKKLLIAKLLKGRQS
jgi:hypothetical protein